jgi:hypothetical protein
MIKVWETKLEGYKRITKGVNEDCQKIFDLIEKDSVHSVTDGFSELLGEINITRYQLKTKEEFEERRQKSQILKWSTLQKLISG